MTRFDEALPAAIGVLQQDLHKPIEQCHIVRDPSGVLVVVLPESQVDAGAWGQLAARLHEALGVYSPGPNRVLLAEPDLIDAEDVIGAPDRVHTDLPNVWLVDRVLNNQDWVKPPLRLKPRVPTAVAYSVKGGVGRSTSLAIGGWHLARSGRNVLVVDLDLEAPGISSMLLAELPEMGLVDWLVEEMNGQGDSDLLQRCIGVCPLSTGESGTLRVLAAHGSKTGAYVSKLGRIYAPTVLESGSVVGLAERLDRLLDMINQLADPPEVVLIDARAGVHDIGSAAVTRLGAEVLMFARNDQQDWWAYKRIFEHLRTSNSVAHGMGSDDDLRWKLKMVAAQTLPREDARRAWVDASYDVWTSFYDDETVPETTAFVPAVFDRDDVDAPHYPLFVNFDVGVRALTLSDGSSRPEWDYVQGIFGDFVAGLERRLLAPTSVDSEGSD